MARPGDQGEPGEERESLVEVCRVLAHEGHEHFFLGHASMRAGTDRYWVKPSGIGLGEVTSAGLVLVDLDGQRIEGDMPLHGELPIHSEIYRARPDVQCVVHTHPFNTAAFSAADARLAMVGQDSVLFADDGVGYYPKPRLVTSALEGRALAAALGPRMAVVLRNHGLATAAPTAALAVVLAVSLERALRLQAAAAAFGPIVEIEREDALAMGSQLGAPHRISALYQFLVRQAAAGPQR